MAPLLDVFRMSSRDEQVEREKKAKPTLRFPSTVGFYHILAGHRPHLYLSTPTSALELELSEVTMPSRKNVLGPVLASRPTLSCSHSTPGSWSRASFPGTGT